MDRHRVKVAGKFSLSVYEKLSKGDVQFPYGAARPWWYSTRLKANAFSKAKLF